MSARSLCKHSDCSRCDFTHKKDSLDTSVKAYMNLEKDKDKEASSFSQEIASQVTPGKFNSCWYLSIMKPTHKHALKLLFDKQNLFLCVNDG